MVAARRCGDHVVMKTPRPDVASEGAATFVCGVCGQPVRIGEEAGRQFLADAEHFAQAHGDCLRQPAAAPRRP